VIFAAKIAFISSQNLQNLQNIIVKEGKPANWRLSNDKRLRSRPNNKKVL
jgi:hypothetical protein